MTMHPDEERALDSVVDKLLRERRVAFAIGRHIWSLWFELPLVTGVQWLRIYHRAGESGVNAPIGELIVPSKLDLRETVKLALNTVIPPLMEEFEEADELASN